MRCPLANALPVQIFSSFFRVDAIVFFGLAAHEPRALADARAHALAMRAFALRMIRCAKRSLRPPTARYRRMDPPRGISGACVARMCCCNVRER